MEKPAATSFSHTYQFQQFTAPTSYSTDYAVSMLGHKILPHHYKATLERLHTLKFNT